MQALISVMLPVFLLIGFGYLGVWRGWLTDGGVDGLMRFAQNFAVPCLLFLAIARLDLGQEFNLRMLASFYAGAGVSFAVGVVGARVLFARPWPDAVAIGFVALFSNALLLGLPITERAFGPESLAGNFMIISVHAPFCYTLGIVAMEIARSGGGGFGRAVGRIGAGLATNPLVIGIAVGFVVNLGGIALPEPLLNATELMARAAIPAALFGLGGVLYRYKPEGDARIIGFLLILSLGLHPAIAWGMAHLLSVETAGLRSVVITAAMSPGVNAYLFANMYGVGRRVAASTVLVGTACTLITGWLWLLILP